MLSQRHRKFLVEMLTLPTAPFAEQYIQRYILDFCGRRPALKARQDAAGNILIHYRHPQVRRKRPLCLSAHMDHPGFRALEVLDNGRLKAQWLGGVTPEYFPKAKVRFFDGNRWIHGRIVKTSLKTLGLENAQTMVDTAEIEFVRPRKAEVPTAAVGMWDLPNPRITGKRIYARGCDDIAGCAALLASLDTLVRRRARAEVYYLFTRAEEVGFIGAIAACEQRTVPKKCLVVAIETSSVLAGVEMGGGPILRVGDKSTVFTPNLTAWCKEVADELTRADSKFRYQRKLMDGGSCESSAFCELGYDATGVCIALGNYHNCNRAKKQIAPEYVHLDDVANMIRWFVALATCKGELHDGNPRLQKRLTHLKRRYSKMLAHTA